MIEEYHFGRIKISGEEYNYDVEVRWTGEVLPWWRAESHIIDVLEVQRALEQNPELVVIGIGARGVARVTAEAQKEIKSRGVELIIDRTEEAIKTFNIIKESSKEEEGREKKIIGLFHLTC